MSLYDDFEPIRQKSDNVAGWSSGIKLFQSQLQLKKATQTLPKRDASRKSAAANVSATSILDFSKNEESSPLLASIVSAYNSSPVKPETKDEFSEVDDYIAMDWNFDGPEYNPLWPNDYERVVRDLRNMRDQEREREEEEKRRQWEERKRNRELRNGDDTNRKRRRDESSSSEDEDDTPPSRSGGVAIAPPAAVLKDAAVDSGKNKGPAQSGASVAAKIMAKYGFKEGQGLGKKEQGMSMALLVEKTSKRGGRIIHEKEIMPPPAFFMPPPPKMNSPPPTTFEEMEAQPAPQPSITEIMKDPTKVVILKNMVGPGEVDSELEPEVKDECNTKYGEVVTVVIKEVENAVPEEAVRIFVEFKRIESAIKAVVDLNGRFFAGRQVKAGFYNLEKFQARQLLA